MLAKRLSTVWYPEEAAMVETNIYGLPSKAIHVFAGLEGPLDLTWQSTCPGRPNQRAAAGGVWEQGSRRWTSHQKNSKLYKSIGSPGLFCTGPRVTGLQPSTPSLSNRSEKSPQAGAVQTRLSLLDFTTVPCLPRILIDTSRYYRVTFICGGHRGGFVCGCQPSGTTF